MDDFAEMASQQLEGRHRRRAEATKTNWTGMARTAQNRVRCQGVVDGLCSSGSDGHK